MKCRHCNTINKEKDILCKNCGMDLFSSTRSGQLLNKYLLILTWIGFAISFAWLIIQRVIIPLFYKKAGVIEWDKVSPIFINYRWLETLFFPFLFTLISLTVENKEPKRVFRIISALIVLFTLLLLILYLVESGN